MGEAMGVAMTLDLDKVKMPLQQISTMSTAWVLSRFPGFRIEFDPERLCWVVRCEGGTIYGAGSIYHNLVFAGASGASVENVLADAVEAITRDGVFVQHREDADWWTSHWDRSNGVWETHLRDEIPKTGDWQRAVPEFRRQLG